MNHFYIPCSQQDNQPGFPQHQPRSFQSSFRRPSSQGPNDAARRCLKGRQTSKNANGTTAICYDSASPPSLGSSSPSSLEDETSPKTPSPDYGNVKSSQQHVGRYVSDLVTSDLRPITAWETYSKNNQVTSVADTGCIARSLPSRSKRNDGETLSGDSRSVNTTSFHAWNHGVAPPIIQETAIRSRLARDVKRDTGYGHQTHNEVATNIPNAVVTANSRCHARRRPCADAHTPVPPKLKRDTDCTDAIVRLIVCLSTKLVHAIWSQSATTPKTSSAFNGAGVLPLKVFIQETLRRSKTSYSTLQVALYYLILLKPHVSSYHSQQEQGIPMCRALQCGRRMFLTALILASKYLQDRNYSSRAWSKISGLPIAEINENERRYLDLIQFDLHMRKEAFENWSKITLSLCKISEASMNETTLMTSDAASIGSDGWWSYQLRRLSAALVQDSKQTDDYLASLTTNKPVDNVSSEQLIASLDTPPSSPDSVDEGVTENNLTKMLSNGSTDSFSSSDIVDFNSSPATSLPSRPNLPNLPTPSTTPRYNHVLPWPKGSCQPSVRCQASSQALLNLDKQAMNIANLDTCPPPKPRPCDLPRSVSYSTKRAPSNLSSAFVSSSLTCSPESIVSDASCSSMRSRSSSISSTSSTWFASGRQICHTEPAPACPTAVSKQDQSSNNFASNIPASYSFYHSGNQAYLSQVDDEGIDLNACVSQSLDKSTTKFLDEGYGSDGRSEFINQKIADVLASMSNQGDWMTCPAASVSQTPLTGPEQVQRRHKRAHSSTTETSLHDEVRHLMWSSQPSIEVVDTPLPTTLKAIQEKEVQFPEKEWANLKRPVPNNMYNKRVALQHQNDVAGNAAAELAARYLRDVTMAN